MGRASTALVIAVVLLAAGACSDDGTDDGDAGETDDETTTTVAESTSSTDPPDSGGDEATVVEPSPVSAPLDQIYPGTEIISAGQVTANWYQEGGNYVVVYSGLDLATIGPACPGNSIQLPTGEFSSVSNAPTADGGCEGASTPEPPQPPQVCGDLIVYTTAIATSEEGTLYGSFEQPSDAGGFVGGTSTVAADAASAPEITTGSPAYTFEGTEFTC